MGAGSGCGGGCRSVEVVGVVGGEGFFVVELGLVGLVAGRWVNLG